MRAHAVRRHKLLFFFQRSLLPRRRNFLLAEYGFFLSFCWHIRSGDCCCVFCDLWYIDGDVNNFYVKQTRKKRNDMQSVRTCKRSSRSIIAVLRGFDRRPCAFLDVQPISIDHCDVPRLCVEYRQSERARVRFLSSRFSFVSFSSHKYLTASTRVLCVLLGISNGLVVIKHHRAGNCKHTKNSKRKQLSSPKQWTVNAEMMAKKCLPKLNELCSGGLLDDDSNT